MLESPREITNTIIAALDVRAEYESLGVKFSGEARESGMISCFAFGREDRKPSAWVATRTGFYGDSGGQGAAGYTCSLFDFAVKAGRFADWQSARKAYADKAGVKLGREKKGDTADWREKLEMQDWSEGNDILAGRWCIQSKPGVTVEAIKAAGGRIAYYPCWLDKKTKERKRGRRQVIAIPAFGEWGLAADPVAWILWDLTGEDFDVTPKGTPPEEGKQLAKMISCGPTRGATLGLHALMVLADPDKRAKVELVWWPEGPTDLLALWAAIPAESRDAVLVVSGAGGATADVPPAQAKLLAGLKVAVVGDCDTAGQTGSLKRARALEGMAAEVRMVKLPFVVHAAHGKDIRDFLLDTETETTEVA